jgi:hypothetical protein
MDRADIGEASRKKLSAIAVQSQQGWGYASSRSGVQQAFAAGGKIHCLAEVGFASSTS